MRRIISHPLIWVIVAIVALYALLANVVDPPMPRSLLVQFMVFAVIGVFMAATFDDVTCKRLFAPIVALLGHPKLWILRFLALVLVVTGASAIAYGWAKPSLDAPIELRSVHPAPPSSLRVYDQSYDLANLENPLRAQYPEGSDGFREIVAEGAELYYANCIFCHGDHLDGKGHFAEAFNPRPANFQDVGTIAQLQESYLFWRITTGGPGLPREGAPWLSAMPAWHEMLKEDEVWKIITFLYDYTGFEPRSWKLGAEGGAAVEEGPVAEEPSTDEAVEEISADRAAIEQIYLKHCAQCHGEEGDGLGPAADFLYPKPRDFTFGQFKFKITSADSEFPFDEDLRKTIKEGLPSTAMPAWGEVLNDSQIDGLILMIKEFGGWDGETLEELGIEPMEMGEPIASSPSSIERGAEVFKKACEQCHGAAGRGNVTSGKKLKDDWDERIWPRNLTRPETWRWTRNVADVFQRLSGGIRGTPMPEHTTTMPIEDRWHVANYVMTLREQAVPLASGETVLRGVRIEGELPTDPDDPAWAQAVPITLPLVPNVIKEPRLFLSLNDTVTVRVVFNDQALSLRLDVDDRTYSVPGDPLEVQYRLDDVEPTSDAVAVQLPSEIPSTSEKPWFRHGDPKHPVNMWYWRAPSVEPAMPEATLLLDARGPAEPPTPRDDSAAIAGAGTWQDGQWRIVFTRALETQDGRDIRLEPGRYIPIAFADWDGWAGQKGSHHTLTAWYWLLLESKESPLALYGATGASGLVAGLLFLAGARSQRRHFRGGDKV